MRKQQINPFEDKRIHTDPLIECQFPQLFIRRMGQIRRQLLFLLASFSCSCGGHSLLGCFRCDRLLREGKRVQGTPGFSGHVIFPIFRSSHCHRSRTSWAALPCGSYSVTPSPTAYASLYLWRETMPWGATGSP